MADKLVSETKFGITHSLQLSGMKPTTPQYADELVMKSLHCEDVYEENDSMKILSKTLTARSVTVCVNARQARTKKVYEVLLYMLRSCLSHMKMI